MTLAQTLLTAARRKATETKGQPDVILAAEYAAFIEDVGKVIDGIGHGYLRRKPTREVRPAKAYRPAIDQVEGEQG